MITFDERYVYYVIRITLMCYNVNVTITLFFLFANGFNRKNSIQTVLSILWCWRENRLVYYFFSICIAKLLNSFICIKVCDMVMRCNSLPRILSMCIRLNNFEEVHYKIKDRLGVVVTSSKTLFVLMWVKFVFNYNSF